MNATESVSLIKKALISAEVDIEDYSLNEDTDLIEEGILDSLDAMTFLFHLEKEVNEKISEIDDEFDDFRIATLIQILSNY
tara:strand:+ start:762 stop:1004 length:243 start_codon:yes stop_codon:yes gene_type:complete